ncbi:MAG: UDP-3-O-acylglucosamine N-acyltransferase [Gammaproteobacteria bacterium]|nr:UDP-3-O-acylglucosamine N-acyltransferase [Gammaproteobacteria bacterium]
MKVTLKELAERTGAALRGDAGITITGIATLDRAQAGDLAFLYNRRYRRFLSVTSASAVLLTPADAGDCPVAALVMDNPYLGYARAAALLAPKLPVSPGIHPTAHVDPTARVEASASIGPHAILEAGVAIGEQVVVGGNAIIGRDTRIGDYTIVKPGARLYHGVTVGRRCLIHSGAVIGADGFGFARDGTQWVKIPQVGGVHIGDDVEIGANSTIDRGALKDTVIEDGVKIDNLVQIGHNVRIGAQSAIAGCTGIAGSATVGRRCLIGGAVGIAGHIEICDDVTVLAKSGVHKSIRKPGVYSSGWPVQEARTWHRYLAAIARLARGRGRTEEDSD